MKIQVLDNIEHYGGQVFNAVEIDRAYKTDCGKFFGFHEAEIVEKDEGCVTCRHYAAHTGKPCPDICRDGIRNGSY